VSRELDLLVSKLKRLKKNPPKPDNPLLPKPRKVSSIVDRATPKQAKFKKALIRTGDKVEAALEAYDTTDRGAAAKLADSAMAKPVIADDVKEILERVGAGQEVAAVALADALQATTPVVVTESSKYGGDPDHKYRISAAREVLKLHDAYPKTKVESHEHKHLHLEAMREFASLPFETLTGMLKTTPVESSPDEAVEGSQEA